MIAATDPRILEFLRRWHEQARARFERDAHSLDYDSYYPRTAHERRKYIALDYGAGNSRSGAYLVDRATGDVYTIKGYGVPNRRVGSLDDLDAVLKTATR